MDEPSDLDITENNDDFDASGAVDEGDATADESRQDGFDGDATQDDDNGEFADNTMDEEEEGFRADEDETADGDDEQIEPYIDGPADEATRDTTQDDIAGATNYSFDDTQNDLDYSAVRHDAEPAERTLDYFTFGRNIGNSDEDDEEDDEDNVLGATRPTIRDVLIDDDDDVREIQSEGDDELDEDGELTSAEAIFNFYVSAYESYEYNSVLLGKLYHYIADMLNRKKKDYNSSNSANGEDDVGGMVNDMEDRYKRYVLEHMKLRRDLEDLYEKNDLSIEEFKMRIYEKEHERLEREDNFRQLKTQAALKAEHGSTGKAINPRYIEQKLELEKKKDEYLKESRIAFIKAKNKKASLESNVKDKEEPSKGLHLIDFEQLKMENSTYSEKIEEKNESLLKSKLKATMTVHILSHVKEKLQFVQTEESELMREYAQLKNDLAEHKDILSQLKRERDALRDLNNHMRDNKPLVGSDQLLLDYETRKKKQIVCKARVVELKEKYEQVQAKLQAYGDLIYYHKEQQEYNARFMYLMRRGNGWLPPIKKMQPRVNPDGTSLASPNDRSLASSTLGLTNTFRMK